MLSFWKHCPDCDSDVLSEGQTHCTQCGGELEYKIHQGFYCEDCGEDIEDDWRFCGFCGAELICDYDEDSKTFSSL